MESGGGDGEMKLKKTKKYGNNGHYYGDAFIWNFNLTFYTVDNTFPF